MTERIGGGETWYGRVDVYFSDVEEAGMSGIKSALTAEEWAAGHREDPANTLHAEGDAGEGLVVDGLFEGRARHALAALALHGQPYGFTWADVDALHDAAPEVFNAHGEMRPLLNLAERLAALLPPREEPKP